MQIQIVTHTNIKNTNCDDVGCGQWDEVSKDEHKNTNRPAHKYESEFVQIRIRVRNKSEHCESGVADRK